MTPITIATLLFSLLASVSANAQPAMPAAKRICMDVAHQQKFWHDPADMAGMDVKMIERVKYMTAELTKTATAVNASLSYLEKEITPKDVEGCDLLFIHIPSARYTPGEVSAISNRISKRRFAVPGDGSGHVVDAGADQRERSDSSVWHPVRRRESRFTGGRPYQSGPPDRQGLENLLSRRQDGHRWHAVRLQRPIGCQSVRHVQRGRERWEGSS